MRFFKINTFICMILIRLYNGNKTFGACNFLLEKSDNGDY